MGERIVMILLSHCFLVQPDVKVYKYVPLQSTLSNTKLIVIRLNESEVSCYVITCQNRY